MNTSYTPSYIYVLLLSVSAESSEEMDAIIGTLVTEQVGFHHLPLLCIYTSPHTVCVYPAGWRFMQEVEDLTCLILRELEESYPWMARSIEQVGRCVRVNASRGEYRAFEWWHLTEYVLVKILPPP